MWAIRSSVNTLSFNHSIYLTARRGEVKFYTISVYLFCLTEKILLPIAAVSRRPDVTEAEFGRDF